MNILYKINIDVHMHIYVRYVYAPCVSHYLRTSELWV